MSDNCSLSEGLKNFDPVDGTSFLKSHYRTRHTEKGESIEEPHKMNSGIKRSIVNASVMDVVQGLLPLSFAYLQDGMVAFASSLVRAGQEVPPSTNVNIPYLLPSPPTVREGVSRLATRLRGEFKEDLPIILGIGGGMTCDGLKLDANGRKYYDLIIHYIDVPKTETIEPIKVMRSRVVFIKGHEYNE